MFFCGRDRGRREGRRGDENKKVGCGTGSGGTLIHRDLVPDDPVGSRIYRALAAGNYPREKRLYVILSTAFSCGGPINSRSYRLESHRRFLDNHDAISPEFLARTQCSAHARDERRVDFTLYINRNKSLTSALRVAIALSIEQPNSSIEQVLIFRPRISSITSTVEQYAACAY